MIQASQKGPAERAIPCLWRFLLSREFRPIGRTGLDLARLLLPAVEDPAIVEDRAIAGANRDLPSLVIELVPERGILIGLREADEAPFFSGPKNPIDPIRRERQILGDGSGFRGAAIPDVLQRIAHRPAGIDELHFLHARRADAVVG